MKVRTVSYTKVFPLMAFVNEKVGIEIELDDTDDVDKTFQLAKELVNKWGTAPALTDGETIKWEVPAPTPPPVIDRKAIERLEILIDDCTTTAEVWQYRDEAERLGLMEYWQIKHQNLRQ